MPLPPRVLLVCSGLDHAHRGFESFARECFETLRHEDAVRIKLVKGSGPSGPDERSVPALRRDQLAVRALGRTLRTRPFRVEEYAFAVSLQPLLLHRRPDVVYLSEWGTARALAAIRAATRQRFKLLLCNGTFAVSGFEHLDHVQELTPAGRGYVLKRGADPARHSVLPLGFRIGPRLALPSGAERATLRARLGLPVDRTIAISVAALNHQHKRLDFVIEELASLPEPRPFLLLVGEPDPETPGVLALARERLGGDGFHARTVRAAAVSDLLRASDVFVLASLFEAQGRAAIEAAAHGLPCLVHDSPVMRFALGEHGIYGDFLQRGSLAALLQLARRLRRCGSPPACL